MGRDHQALVAAPARAHAEDVHAVEHRGQRVAAVAVAQGEGEQAGRALELLLPVVVAGAVGQGGMQHLVDLGPVLQPVRDLDAALLVMAQPHAHGAQAAQREVAIVGRGVEAEILAGRLGRLEHLPRGAGDDAHHRVGVADDVLGAGVDREVAAMVERLEVERRRPGVVDQHGRAVLLGDARRWRRRPAPRRSASRAPRDRRPWCWAASASRCRRRSSDRRRSSRRRSSSAWCWRSAAPDRRRCRSAACGRRSSGSPRSRR